MSRPRWAELVRNCPHGVSAPNRAHLASLLTPVPFPVFWQVCSDPIQPVFQGEASSVGPGDAKVTTLPSPPPSAWPDLLSRARLCSGVYTLDKVGKGPGGVPAKSTLPLSPALRDASGDRFCLDGLVEPSPEGPLHLARLGDGECLKPGRAGTQPPWEAQPSHPGYSESGLRPQPPWEAQPSHPGHPESGLELNHPGKPSLPIPAILSLGCPGKPSLPLPAILSLGWDSTTLGSPAFPSRPSRVWAAFVSLTFLAWGRGMVEGLLSTSRAPSLQPVYPCVPHVGGAGSRRVSCQL